MSDSCQRSHKSTSPRVFTHKIDVKMAKMLALALLVGAQAFVNNPARSLRNFGLRTATRSPAAPQMLFGLSLKVRPT